MKKLFAMALVAFSAFGFSGAFAHGDECHDPVGVNCTYEDENGRDVSCTVYVNTEATGLNCINP